MEKERKREETGPVQSQYGTSTVGAAQAGADRYDSRVDLANENNSHTQIILLTGHGKKVLEVGAATGYVSKALAERDCRVTGIEIDAGAARIAEEFCDRMIVGDIEKLNLEAMLAGERFDVVIFGDVLEHLTDPARMLSSVRTLLEPGGHVVASIPNVAHGSVRLALLAGNFDYTEVGLLDRTHIRFFDRDGVADLFAESGYIIDLWRCVQLDPLGTEIALRQGDFPEHLLTALRRDQEALTYQYVVKASLNPDPIDITRKRPREAQKDVSAALKALMTLVEQDRLNFEGEIARARLDAHRQAALAMQVQAALEEREAQLHEREAALDAARYQLSAIQASAGYRLLEAVRRPLRWLFPVGSRRAAPYRLFMRIVKGSMSVAGSTLKLLRRGPSLAFRSRQIIRHEGWRSFAGRAKRKCLVTIRRRPVPTAPLPITYEEWIIANEPGEAELELQRCSAHLLPYRPLISFITPVWNAPPDLLRKTIESVRAQTYDNWELCLTDGGSEDPDVKGILQRFSTGDARIKVLFLNENQGISGNSNAALAAAVGEYVAFLDHTDTLAPNALWEVCALLNRDPATDCVYSDHDLITEQDERYQPLFKPRFSPETLLSAHYMAHFSLFRKGLVDRLGGLRPEMDGAQDWDLALRAVASGATFAHVPKVLYHWRTDSTSAATSPFNKTYALRAQERALQDHLDARGSPGTVLRDEYGGPMIKWQVSGRTKVSIVIPTRHNRKLLEPCLRSIGRSNYKNWEIIVVDSAGHSNEREKWYQDIRQSVPLKVLWWEGPFNYSAVNNLAAAQADGDALLFLNDDTEARSPDWLDEMVGWLEQDDIGVVGAQLLFADGRIQHGGDILGLQGFADHLFTGCGPNDWTLFGSTRWYRNLTATTGACLLIGADLFRRIGGYNEQFVLCGSDVELCLRARRAGYRIVCTPFAGIIHHERSTRGNWDVKGDAFASYWYYQRLINGGDPYYNPNLSVLSSIPHLRHPEEPLPAQIIAPAIGREHSTKKQGSADIETEAQTLVEWCHIKPGEVEATRQLHDSNSEPFEIRTINWFIPDMVSPFYGGVHTIFRFAAHFKKRYGVENRFIVVGSGPEPLVRSGITAAFPELADCDIRLCSLAEDDIQAQPYADASIASLWVTAYAVSKFGNTRRKFYMVQDYEPVFYPAGTLYALTEATYRLGLYGLCNTRTLQDIYQDEYGGKGFGFIPAVDTTLFHPPEGPRHEGETMLLFLYGRPGTWRNCYELAIATLRRLKHRLKRKVRIVTAGSWVSSGDSESNYLVDSLGLLDYEDTADLYRKCDVGLTLSVSKHPSYLPIELMASGATVVSNYNPSGFWLLHDEENCLLAEPTAESLCAALERALTDDTLRERLGKQAVADIQANHSDWPTQIDNVYRYICDPEAASP